MADTEEEPQPGEYAHLLSPVALAVSLTRDRANPYRPGRHHTFLNDELVKLHSRPPGYPRRLMVMQPPQHGKELSHKTLVPTPSGMVEHGALRPGDLVLGRDGRPYPVLAIGEESLEDDVRVTFSDGTSVVCHERHEWTTFDRSHREERVVETAQFFHCKLETGPANKRGHRYRFQIPLIAPAWGPVRDLPVDPYVLGAWLGDGTSTGGTITHHDSDRHVIERAASRFRVGHVAVNRFYPQTSRTGFIGLAPALHKLKVLNNKHIPDSYLFASESQRRELLAGLIDTDGYVHDGNGRVVFSNTNVRLLDNVRTLVCSLGYRTTLCRFEPQTTTSGIVGKKPVYQLCFTPHDQDVASMPRKRHGVLGIRRRQAIVKVERVPPEMGRCIQTAAPDGVYLVTKNFIPTHNSELCSHWFPVWNLAIEPTTRVILASYSLQLAAGKFGKQARKTVQEFYPILGARIVDDTRSAHSWATAAGGYMESRGISGGISGLGYDVGIIDDPIKDAQEAQSKVIRDNIWDWWETTFKTRRSADAIIVCVMTHWHDDDLCGRLLATEPELWRVVKLPALAEANDPLGRELDEPLWPERYPKSFYESERKKSSRAFNALYQQRPAPPEGAALHRTWWRHYTKAIPLSDFQMLIQTWDTTFKDVASSDFVAGWLLGLKGSDIYVLDGVKERMNTPATMKAIQAWREKYPQAKRILIEEAASGASIIQLLQHTMSGITPISPHGRSKETRLHFETNSVAGFVEAGHVFLPARNEEEAQPLTPHLCELAQGLVEEAAAFPFGANDDQLDAFVQGAQWLMPRVWSAERRAESAQADSQIVTPIQYESKRLKDILTKRMKTHWKEALEAQRNGGVGSRFPGW